MKSSGNIRLVVDAGLIISLLSIAFWVGVQSEKINTLETAVRDRGRVQISIEADHRLTVLEEQVRHIQDSK